MPDRSKHNNGKYLYAIVADAGEHCYGDIGINDSEVYNITDGSAAAVVSDFSNNRIRPERRNLAAHQRVLKQIMQTNTPLPMAFGIIAAGPREIKKILSRNRDAFREQLQRVACRVEMGLRVTWDVPNIIEYFVDTYPKLRTARDQFLSANREPTHEEKILVGRMFERILNEEREAYTEKVEEILVPQCVETKRNRQKNENEIMNLACLVENRAQDEFESAIFEAAQLFDNKFSFDFSGPWAPHNFVDLDLQF